VLIIIYLELLVVWVAYLFPIRALYFIFNFSISISIILKNIVNVYNNNNTNNTNKTNKTKPDILESKVVDYIF